MTTASPAEVHFRALAPAVMHNLMADFPGLTIEDAAAILGNLGHECAGFTKLQEIKPTVKGSRGGYGWAQWTGPRREAYEAYCARNGKDPASDEANYAYLFLELKGIEGTGGGTLPKVRQAVGLEAKVKAFELAFLRAGAKNYPSRVKWAERAMDAYGAAVPVSEPVEPVSPVPAAPVPAEPPAVPLPHPVEPYEAPIGEVVTRTAQPSKRALIGIVVASALAAAVVWLWGQQPTLGQDVVFPAVRGAAAGGGFFKDVAVQIALAFLAPLAAAAATAAAGWITYWWSRILKSDFDKKSADQLHAALERGILYALQALGAKAGQGQLLETAAAYVQHWNGGTVKRFGLGASDLTELAMSHLARLTKVVDE